MQRYARIRIRPRPPLGPVGALLLALAAGAALAPGAGVVRACALDNIASLFANGVQARLNADTPSATGLWATFTVPAAFASGSPVALAENRAELARNLRPAVLDRPYRWSFGDGTVALGRAAAHRYIRPGTYRLVVYGFDPRAARWFAFDSALLRIVPPDAVLQANLGYDALRGLDLAMSALGWVIDAGLIGLVLWVALGRRRSRPHASHRGDASA